MTDPTAQAREFSRRVVSAEGGNTVIEVTPALVLEDGPCRVTCAWSDEDAAYIARLHDAEPQPFHATVMAHGDTREEALAHLTLSAYTLALAMHQSTAAVRRATLDEARQKLATRFDESANHAKAEGYIESAECYTVARNIVLITLTGDGT